MGVISAAFAEQIYEIVAAIPEGKVATYGQIAQMLQVPNMGREVGSVMANAGGKNLPCHRVVSRTGALAPGYVFGGEEKQRAMLEAEGVTFIAGGRINMARHQWGECEQLAFG